MPHQAKLQLYQVHAVTEGTDAQAEVSVRLEEDGKSVTARGTIRIRWSPRPRRISRALNKLAHKRETVNPQTAYG